MGLGDGALQAAEPLEKGQKTCSDLCELGEKARNRQEIALWSGWAGKDEPRVLAVTG